MHLSSKDKHRLRIKSWEKSPHANGTVTLISDKTDIQLKNIRIDRDEHYTMIQRTTHQQHIFTKEALKSVRQSLSNLKTDIGEKTHGWSYSNKHTQKINRDTAAVDKELDHSSLKDSWLLQGTAPLKSWIYVLLKHTWDILQDWPYMGVTSQVSTKSWRLQSYQAPSLTTMASK